MRENCTYGSMRGRAFPTGRPALLYNFAFCGASRTEIRGPSPPHISNTFRVFSDGLRPFSVFSGKYSPTSLPRLRPVNTERAEVRRHGEWF